MVSWWKAENNANDSLGANHGTFGGSYMGGQVGQTFRVVDSSSAVTIPASASLNVGSGGSFTIEGWINVYDDDTGGRPVFEWAGASASNLGVHVWVNYVYLGSVFVNIVDTSGSSHYFWAYFAGIQSKKFQHLAVTYNHSSGDCLILVDGNLVLTERVGVVTPQTSYPLYLGYRPPNLGTRTFNGVIDEVSLYNRALSPEEIQAIYAAQSAGKCTSSQPVAPSITTQPQSQTVEAWNPATFTVVANGTPPLSYQWRFNGADIPGAISSTFTRNNVEPAHAGIYSVFVWNTAGNATSSGATLTVIQPDTDSDGLPDWWELKYFGGLAQGDTEYYDMDESANSSEYLNGTDPNSIRFSTAYPNNFINASTVNGTITVVGGVPSQMVVLVDAVDHSGVNWVTYTSSFTAILPSSDGPHVIQVGLRGRSTDSEQTWDKTTIWRDTTAPLVIITNPVSSGTLSRPMIQVQGYSIEPLSNLRYDVSNSLGTQNDLQGLVSLQFYDKNVGCLTTNFFQCYDIDLASGANTITLRATDLAGNVTTKTLTYTLVSDSVSPGITFRWPQNGMKLCGTTFTVDGLVDDPTANVALTLTPAVGPANAFAGLVERDGHFWFENLPLPDGTSIISVTATDPWNNSATSTMCVTRTSFGLTIDVDQNLLSQSQMSVGGTIESPSYSVRVNGIVAQNYGNGSWFASEVPVSSGGTATFDVSAYPPGHDGEAAFAVSLNAEVDKPLRLYVEHHDQNSGLNWDKQLNFFYNDNGHIGSLKDWAHTTWSETSGHDWTDDKSSTGSWTRHQTWEGQGSPPGGNDCTANVVWPATSWPDLVSGNWNSNPDCANARFPEFGPCVPMEHCEASSTTDRTWGPSIIHVDPYFNDFGSGTYHEDYTRSAHSSVKLFTGGKGVPYRRNIIQIYGPAYKVSNPRSACGTSGDVLIPAADTTLGELGKLGLDYNLFAALPDGVTKDVTLKTSEKVYTYALTPIKHVFRIAANGWPLSNDRVAPNAQFCVGQKVNLTSYLTPSADDVILSLDVRWFVAGGFVNYIESWPAGAKKYLINWNLTYLQDTHVWWVDGGEKHPRCDWTISFKNGQSAKITTNGRLAMHRPTFGHLTLSPPYFPSIITIYGFMALSLGDLNQQGAMLYQCSLLSDFSGTANTTQLINRDVKRDVLSNITTDGQYALDTSEWYEIPTVVTPGRESWLGWFSDVPSCQVGMTYITINDQFRDYIRFKPDGDDSIWVTIARIDWSWFGSARSPTWAPPSGSVASPVQLDDQSFPFWSSVITSFGPGL
jgi:hypothetical protein